MANYVTRNISLFSAIAIAIAVLFVGVSSLGAAPKGYCVLPKENITWQIVKIARSMLNKPLGTCTPFNIADKNYQGCVEWHWDKVKGKHIGVTVYRECSENK